MVSLRLVPGLMFAAAVFGQAGGPTPPAIVAQVAQLKQSLPAPKE